jgi:hypothetical protein
MNPAVKVVALGLLLGCVFAVNCYFFKGKSHWQLNLLIGVVTMAMSTLLDRLFPGIGVVVSFALGILASTTVTKMM